MKALFAPLLFMAAVLSPVSEAQACVGTVYDTSGITAQSVASDMVQSAATIDIMRVVSRLTVPADPLFGEYYGEIYEFRLETIERLKGRSRGVISITAPDANWLERRIPGARSEGHVPLWWLSAFGYQRLQNLSVFEPSDFYSTTCASPLTFEIGASYLIFRDDSGALLPPGFAPGPVPRRGPELQRPAAERVHGSADPWLNAVRHALRR